MLCDVDECITKSYAAHKWKISESLRSLKLLINLFVILFSSIKACVDFDRICEWQWSASSKRLALKSSVKGLAFDVLRPKNNKSKHLNVLASGTSQIGSLYQLYLFALHFL